MSSTTITTTTITTTTTTAAASGGGSLGTGLRRDKIGHLPVSLEAQVTAPILHLPPIGQNITTSAPVVHKMFIDASSDVNGRHVCGVHVHIGAVVSLEIGLDGAKTVKRRHAKWRGG
jgi:hypothetical protein